MIQKGVMHVYRITIFAMILIVALVLIPYEPLVAATVKIEAETFSASNNINYDPIAISPDLTCSGGQMIAGLDCYNEWVEFDIEIGVEGDYEVYMHCRGDYGLAYWFQLSLTPVGGGMVHTLTLNFLGVGYG